MKLPTLKPGDLIEIIAPASRCSDDLLQKIITELESWQLNCRIEPTIFGQDILCANSDEMRFQALCRALERKETKAILCARGGYGSMRLIPRLWTKQFQGPPKLFIGMSDITALNLFLEKKLKWPSLHSALAMDKFSESSVLSLKEKIFHNKTMVLKGQALNASAGQKRIIETSITGGNLCLVQASIGTLWQMEGKNKIIFLEDVSERAYRIDRMLEHLNQALLFKDAQAILFGDFIKGEEPNGSSLIQAVLKRFAENLDVPVIQIPGLGHDATSYPLPLGVKLQLHLGQDIQLCY